LQNSVLDRDAVARDREAMRLTVRRAWTAFFALFLTFALGARAAPAEAGGKPRTSGTPARPLDTSGRIGLYSPRLRRSAVMYLRLRLLELREEGLDRARAVIEHRLSIDDLLGEPARPAGKATARPRRSVGP
jgi:hypothetical protein